MDGPRIQGLRRIERAGLLARVQGAGPAPEQLGLITRKAESDSVSWASVTWDTGKDPWLLPTLTDPRGDVDDQLPRLFVTGIVLVFCIIFFHQFY